MTLNITLLTEETIYQSADFRLTDPNAGLLTNDSSSKLVVMGGLKWQGFIAYTGVGNWKGKDTSAWLVYWLKDHNLDPAEFVERVRRKGTAWLKKIERDTKQRWRHSFIAAAFLNGRPTVWVISNFEDANGFQASFPAPALDVSKHTYGGRPKVLITGQRQSVDRNARRRLAHLGAGQSDPAKVRRVLAEINERAAGSPESKDTVSAACSVISFRSDGQGVTDISPEAAVEIRSIYGGIPAPSINELERMLGRKLGGVGGATYATSAPNKPFPPCKPVVRGQGIDGYRLQELQHPEIESLCVRDVSDSGLILGAGSHPQMGGVTMPWLAKEGREPELCGFVGQAAAVNDDGVIAASVDLGDGGSRAHRWHGQQGEELELHRGTTSSARAIDADGTVAGYVCIDPDDRGQPNFRPAAWLPDGELKVLEDSSFDWGEAVAVVGSEVLIWAHRGSSGEELLALLWSLEDGAVRQVGRLGVNAKAMTSSGLVLGTARGKHGLPETYLARVGESWKPLGTPPGASGSSIIDAEDIVGATRKEGFHRPWLRRASGTIIPLPYYEYHWCAPSSINSSGLIGGTARADHGSHALLWMPAVSTA